MKRTLLLLALVLTSALVGCSGGGGGGGSANVNPYGFSFSTLTPANTPTLTSANVLALAVKADFTRLYVGTGGGLFIGDPDAGTMIFTKDDSALLAGKSVQALLRDTNGHLLIGTDNGLFRRNVNTGEVTAFAAMAGMNVLSLAQPDANTLWVGMRDDTPATRCIARSGDGGNTFTFFGTAENITANAVVQIYADTSIVMACGTGAVGKAGLFRFSAAGNGFILQDTPLANGVTMFNQIGSTWYVGGTNGGLFSSSNSGLNWTKIIDAVTPYQVTQEGLRFWIPSSNGLYVTYDFAAFTLYNTGNRLNRDESRSLVYTRDHVWISHPGAGGALNRGLFTGE